MAIKKSRIIILCEIRWVSFFMIFIKNRLNWHEGGLECIDVFATVWNS